MARTDYELTGFRELDQALEELTGKAVLRIGRKSLRDAAAPILEKYKAGTTVKSGALERNEVAGTRLNRRQRKLTPKPGPSEIEIHIGTADPAGLQEEFGIRQPANPALTRAWDAEGGETAIERVGASLGRGIEREAARQRRGR